MGGDKASGKRPFRKSTIADVKDAEKLKLLKTESISRGKKQRINKKLKGMEAGIEKMKQEAAAPVSAATAATTPVVAAPAPVVV